MADQFGSSVAPMLPQDDRYAQFKKQQAAVMQQHKAYSADLEKKQQGVAKRQGDLDIAGRLFKILDSRISKPARQFLSKELAQHVGVDPKSEQFRGVSTMLTGLDPDTLQSLKSSFATSLDGASPGQITDTIKGIMTGQVSMNDFLDQVGSATMHTSQGVSGNAGTDQLAGGPGEDMLAPGSGSGAPAPTLPEPFQAGASGNVSSLEGQRTINPVDQPASPSITSALGLDSRTLYRNKDLIQGGFKIPFDAKDQDKIATEINTRSTGISATMSEAAKLVDLFEGKPEVLGAVGSGVRTLQSTIQQIQGLMNVINPALQDVSTPYDASIQKLTREVGTQLAKSHSIDVTASNAAQIDSMTLGLAYRMAIANDIPGNRLTNVILEQNLRQLGSSSSPQQFKSVLANTLASTTREFNESIRRTVGASGTDLIARQMSEADLDGFAQRAEKDTKSGGPDLLPVELRQSLLNEAIRRKTGEGGQPVITPSSPTIEEEQRTLGTLETQRKGREIQKTEQSMDIQRSQEERAGRTEVRQDTREERMTASQERSAQIQREQFDYSKAEHERDNAFQREQFEYKKSQDTKADDERRSEKIAAAFRHFGAAISSSRGGGGSVGVPNLGGGQDVSAFRITPPPQRTPPRPGGSR